MKVHLRQIPQGDTLHLEGEEDVSGWGLEAAGAEPLGPLSYSLDVGVSDGGIFATGSLNLRVRMECVKCLEPFEYDIELYDFALQKELEGTELVDLTPEAREDIHLALPAYPHCDATGERTCPASFPAAPTSVTETTGPSPWEELDQLKKQD